MGESEEKDHEVQEILADLDQILNDISGGDQGKAEAIAHAASTPVVPPKPAPAPAPVKPPVSQPPTISLTPAAAAPAPKPAPASVPAPKPAPAPVPVPVAQPQQPPTISLTPAAPPPAPKPVAAPVPAPAPAAAEAFKIELAPRQGTLSAPKKEATIPPKAPKPLETRPPLEISLDALAAAPKPAPAPAPAPPAPKPAAAPTPVPAAAAVSSAALSAREGLKDAIPDKTPKEQIRRVSVIHYGPQLEARDKFMSFLDTSALTVSKKPLYLRKVHGEVYAQQSDAKAVAARAKAVSAVAMLALLDGLPDAKIRELSEACEAGGMNFRVVAPDEIQRRSVAVDIMVDLMLLAGEA